ncbi:tRNA (N6-isopentenyl adenosine(37)-C2)-methylthiotransferase MiaB [Desulfosarcina ovata]|uniref:tRNA-2-methylthio-N(6)-dimethylallyladenosine synthase n=1 Tax=Desulfosarcina ovata subsp. ovata TaxID=2752305 RepID=A0A5K8A355_9BACT|nr:tRNA (N6-isopentenyl adenosine(37)-C2)-methylthiotransferase MiaB [Desulfosarcina ovata]BBO86979.1 tRNA-2-methylthio-N(6)-dimethylallyladenosine synthase [Desulfosarcina ovata subsp. ovata]
MNSKLLHISTIGCQMNVYDANQIAGVLAPMGYCGTDDIASADMVIVNTCTIREKAEQKAFSFLGRLAKLKAANPAMIVAVGGCVAQQEGKAILKRMPHVDLVFGTHAIFRLPEMVRRIEASRCRIVDVRLSDTIEFDGPVAGPLADGQVSAFVTIMRGCDNFCTYCVVPHVRGREASRHPDRILDEIRMRVDQGVREVTLLGQNVNSYGNKEGLCRFYELLERVNGIDGLSRIRFTTSHPKDLSRELIDAFGRLEKLCHHMHLPVQSGDDGILKRMNRRYTRDSYLDKIERLRTTCPDIAITSDFIVGFPGETDRQFQATLDLIEKVRYDGLFAFMYSDRPSAPATAFSGKIDESVKKERLQALLALQTGITREKHQTLVGQIREVLVEGTSRSLDTDGLASVDHTIQWTGRTSSNHIVHFAVPDDQATGKELLTGAFANIMIERAHAHSLWGRLVQGPMGATPEKGEKPIAA